MASTSARQPDLKPLVHHEVMKALGERFAAEMPALADATLAALEAELPELVAELDRDFLRAGVGLTNARMADHLRGIPPETDPTAAPGADRPHVQLARVAADLGIPLPTLERGYRLGAALAWDVVVRLAEDLPLTPAAALELAELHVAYVDTLSADSLAGFRAAAEAAGAALARDRQLLVEALLHGGGTDVAALAEAARWPLPTRARAGVVRGDASELPAALLVGRSEGATVVLVGEDGPTLDPKLPLALGPALPLAEARTSLTQARRLTALAAAGRLGDMAGPLLRWDDHLPVLVVHADPAASDALAARALAPLDGLPEPHARLLAETLAAWLDHPGQPAAMGRALHLHPQTVRYRIGRLRDRFGAALDDPAARFELGLALRIRRGGR